MQLTKTEPQMTDLARIKALSSDELRAELASALGLTARHLLYLAAVWKELEDRGEDLSDLRSGIGTYLPAIAAGTVLPETVVRFAGQPTLLRAVAALTPDEQRKLSEGGTVPVVERSGEGYTHRMLPAHALTATQARLVFGERKVRSEPEQIALLTTAPVKPARSGKPLRHGKARADRDKKAIRVGKYTVPLADVLAAIADLRDGPPLADDPEYPVTTKLTDEERKKLGHAAIEGGVSQQDLIRRTLRANGLI